MKTDNYYLVKSSTFTSTWSQFKTTSDQTQTCKDVRFQSYCGNITYLEEQTEDKDKTIKTCCGELH